MRADSNHQTPEDMSYERETKLRKIANKGVVALFNAVRRQQKAEQEAHDAAEARGKFLDDIKTKTATQRQEQAQGQKAGQVSLRTLCAAVAGQQNK